MRALAAYLQIVSMTTQMLVAYRVAILLELTTVLFQVFVLKMVWTAVYAGQAEIEGVPLDMTVAYLTLANLHMLMVAPTMAWMIAEQVREGKVALDLARPVPFLGVMMARQVGDTVGFFPLILLALPFALVVGGLAPPVSAAAALLYVVSFVLGYGITVLAGLLLGLIAFWTLEIGSFSTVYRFLQQFFGGAMVPLWLFPDWLRAIAGVLPFQGEAYIPLAIYFGRIEGAAVPQALALQVFWLVALYALGLAIWRRAERRVIVQGG